ncbi:spermidine/putrescine transport system permease protein [Lachnospiraceae bacterium XBB1006]|nr:spermidine/putrescine transport system permease protein [Lachnospiraceae bacterium XBB1006]
MRNRLRSSMAPITMIGPTTLWLILFLMIPLALVIGISFLTRNGFGGVLMIPSIDAYKELVSTEYLKVFASSFQLAFLTTIICLVVGYPFAYIIANSSERVKPFLVLLLMLPFWINSMIRIYGWNTILRSSGMVNNALISLGIIKFPLELLYTDGAVLLGMVYDLLPFTVLPIYTSIEKLDPSLLEAASDLGAGKVHKFVRVILPLTMPGVFAGSIQTFIPSLGLFYIADMMGGAKTMYIGNLIKNQFMSARNWPMGAALAIVLIAVTLVLMKLYTRVGSLDDMV